MWTDLPSLLMTVFFFDHPGFIHRSLAHTQIEDKVWSTDITKREFV